MGLQGCDLPKVEGYFNIFSLDIATHEVPYWRQEVDVYEKASYTDAATGEKKFNSCMDPNIDPQTVCGEHGYCSPFDRNNIVTPMFFCKCYEGWAGAECEVPQKSQTYAWLLSLIVGFLGVDELYLGWMKWFILKILGCVIAILFSLVGFPRPGIMFVLLFWFFDIVRIGSAPVRAVDAKVAADLPRWAFATFTMLYFAFVGFGLGINTVYWRVKFKRRMDDHRKHYGSMSSPSKMVF